MVGEYGMLILQMLMLMMELEQGGRGTQRGFEERSLMSSLTLTLTPPSTPLTQAPPHPQGLGVNFSFCLKCFVKVTFSDICSLIIISIWIWFRLIWKQERCCLIICLPSQLSVNVSIFRVHTNQGTNQLNNQPTKAAWEHLDI